MVINGYKETDYGVLPINWNIVTIGEIAIDMADGPFGSNLKKVHYTDKREARIIQLSNIGEDGWKDENTKYTTFEHARTISRCIVNSGNAVVAKMMPAGRAIVCPNEEPMYILSSDAVKIVFNEKEVLTNFFVYATKTKIFQQQIADEIQGSTRARTSVSKLRKNIIALPPVTEQTAIVEAISDIDNFIISLEKLIEKKKAIKKGAMQQLLTGKKRLPGFENKWIKTKLGSLVDIRRGQTMSSDDYVKGVVPVIAGGKEPAGYHNEFNRDKNTITISASGANAGFVNFHRYPIFATDCSTIEGSNGFNILFIYYVMLLNQEVIYRSQTGGAQPHIHPKDLVELVVNYTFDLEEQNSIAEVLFNMDLEIEKLLEKLYKYKAIKQGMMQELLTGRIRLI